MIDRRSAVLAAVCLAVMTAPADAQIERPIPPAVFDARLLFAGLGEDEVTAAALDVQPDLLPSRGFGFVAGLHVYPIRRGGFAMGLGGEFIRVRGTGRPLPDEDPTTPIEPDVHRVLQGLSGQLSLNFGHRDGWSYLTAGMGPFVFQTYAGDTAPPDPPRKSTINMGGGARWFLNRHVGLNFDARFYLTRPEDPSGATPPRERHRVMVLSVGLSVK